MPWPFRAPRSVLAFRPRIEPQLWLILALPLALLVGNGSWLWDNPIYFDTNVYVGFFRHYLEFKLPYIANYKSSRLPFVLPGVLLYRLLPAAVAHHALHLSFLGAEALAIYALVRRRFGAHAALVTAAAVVTSTFSHTLASYHNQAAATYLMVSLLLLEEPARAPWPARFAAAGGVFAMGATTDSILGLLAPLFALHALGALPRPRAPLRIALGAAIVVVGGVVALGLLGLLNVALGGPFLFFLEQLRYSADMAKGQGLSRVPLTVFPRQIFQFPCLALPAVVAVASFGLLLARALRRRWGWAALEAAGYLVSLALAAAAEARGLAVLEQHCLFQVFCAPMFLALGALLGGFAWPGDARISWRFAALVAVLFVAPLSLAGGLASRLLIRAGAMWPAAALGVPFVFGLAAVVAVLAWWWRNRNPWPAVAIAAALGLGNALCTEPSQPAAMYQVGARCPFRAETFDALLEVDEVLSAFDPKNEARWVSSPPPFEEPIFDGHDWCHRLSPETAARSALLTHYFYTSAELVHGAMTPPLKKVTIVATGAPQMANLVAAVQTGVPPGYTLQLRVAQQFSHTTFTLFVKGFDVVARSGAGNEARGASTVAGGGAG